MLLCPTHFDFPLCLFRLFHVSSSESVEKIRQKIPTKVDKIFEARPYHFRSCYHRLQKRSVIQMLYAFFFLSCIISKYRLPRYYILQLLLFM